MKNQIIYAEKSTCLRRNENTPLNISICEENLEKIYLINGNSFLTHDVKLSNMKVKPNDFYMIINNSEDNIEVFYSIDINNHKIVYDPYKYESIKKQDIKKEDVKKYYSVPDGYIDVLPKWYSFKFTYPDYNIIFLKPEYGISIQIHEFRSETWEIINGKPIIINGNKVYYHVPNGSRFTNRIKEYHSIINPNKDKFVILKEYWKGYFDEDDITRIFNPNNYR